MIKYIFLKKIKTLDAKMIKRHFRRFRFNISLFLSGQKRAYVKMKDLIVPLFLFYFFLTGNVFMVLKLLYFITSM